MSKVANRNIVLEALKRKNSEGYGSMSTHSGSYGSAGNLPNRLKNLFYSRTGTKNIGQVIYSYGTPIAWFDTEFDVWVIPSVKYSVTTAKHQGYLWQLSYTGNKRTVSIEWDTPLSEYLRVCKGLMMYANGRTYPQN